MESILSALKETFLTTLGGAIGEWGPKVVMALVTLIIGLWIIRMIMKGVGRMMELLDVDASLKPFLLTLLGFPIEGDALHRHRWANRRGDDKLHCCPRGSWPSCRDGAPRESWKLCSWCADPDIQTIQGR